MTQIIVGNLPRDGSAADLTSDNGTLIPSDPANYYQAGFIATHVYSNANLDILNLAGWNAEGSKGIAITNGDYFGLSVTNYVDVAILGGSYQFIEINQAKRATVDLSDAHTGTYLAITPYSNNAIWSNHYQVTMGSGNDHVTFSMADSSNPRTTKWTEFTVNLGAGNDSFYYDLFAAASGDQQRSVDGGSGFDSLLLGADSSDLDFANFEYITVAEGQTLTLTGAELENNASANNELGLIINGTVALDDDVPLLGMSINQLSAAQVALLEQSGYDSEGVVAVQLYTGDGDNAYSYDDTYTLLVKESDIDYRTFNFSHTSGSSGDTYWAASYGLSYFYLWSSYQYQSTQWLEVNATLGSDNDLVVYQFTAAANADISRFIDGGSGIDALILYDDVNGLAFQNFEKIYNQTDQTLLLTQERLAANAASSSLGVIGDFAVSENIDELTMNLLNASSSFWSHYYIDYTEYTTGYNYDDYDTTTLDVPMSFDLQIGENHYSLITELKYFSYNAESVIYRLDADYDEYSVESFDFEFAASDDTVYYNVSFNLTEPYADASSVFDHYHFAVDGGAGFDTLSVEQAPEYLTFRNFEYLDIAFDGNIQLNQTLLANNASADDGLIVNAGVTLVDDIQGIFVTQLTASQQALFTRAGLASDEYSAVTVYYDDDSYTLLIDVDDLAYHLAA